MQTANEHLFTETLSSESNELFTMTEEQRFHFDLKGWVCIPNVLDEDFCRECSEYLQMSRQEPEKLDEISRVRPSLTGPLGELLDHPVLVGILNEIIGPPIEPLEGQEHSGYGFRCESSFSVVRTFGKGKWQPHCGNSGSNPHQYTCLNSRIYSGQTRAAWEFNPVEPGDGGTHFMSGTHKMNFEIPEEYKKESSGMFETYSCPAGSLVIFCERVMHTGYPWQNEERPRIGVFNCYNHAEAQVHRLAVPYELVMRMPEKRRALFRGVWRWWNRHDGHLENNTTYDEVNRAI